MTTEMTADRNLSMKVGAPWSHDGLNFHGMSLSGVRTTIAMPDLQIAFDVAQGFPFLFPMRKFFISHGHLDHAAGIPYIISQKVLMDTSPADFYMPSSLVQPLTQIMKLWEEVENHQYDCRFHAVDTNEIPVNSQYFVKAFPTHHRIESFGYTLFHRKKKLGKAFSGADRDVIVRARQAGQEIHDTVDTPLVSFTGDTKIEFLFGPEWIVQSKILLMECTYLDEERPVERARQWGHTHLDEIIQQLDHIQSEKIVLIHLSSRYSDEAARLLIEKKIPAKHRERIVLFPGR